MRIWTFLLAAWLVGCAAPKKPISTAETPAWSGRLSVKIDASSEAPSQQTSAGFTLAGNANAGQLHLFTPLGTKAGEVIWDAEFATLSDGTTTQRFASLEAALEFAVGAKIPAQYLFDWLQGKQNKALEASMGWEADLARLADGRLVATRVQPLPRIELRVILEQ